MDEIDAKLIFGTETYEKACDILGRGGLKETEDLGFGMTVVKVQDRGSTATVLIRRYEDGREPLYDCDCSKGTCVHIAAVVMSDMNDVLETYEDDPADISMIESMIASLQDDVEGDPDYDEDANYYEDWEIEKYGLENNNRDVEYDHTKRICDEIVDGIGDPQNILLLFDSLEKEVATFECDNDGYDDAISEHNDMLKVMIQYATPETVAVMLSGNGHRYRKSIAEKLKDSIPGDILDAAYDFIEDKEDLSVILLDMLLENEEYERYVEKSYDKAEALIKVISILKDSDLERARAFGPRLAEECKWKNDKVAESLESIGITDYSMELYKERFLERPNGKDFDRIRSISDDTTAESILDEAAERHLHRTDFIPDVMSFLANSGRCKEVDGFLRSIDFKFAGDSRWGIMLGGMELLCRALASNGYPESAAELAHRLIEYRLDTKDSKSYGDAVSMMMFLDSQPVFESMDPPHSKYRQELRAERRTMRKFWGMYNGTWVEKKPERRYWRGRSRRSPVIEGFVCRSDMNVASDRRRPPRRRIPAFTSRSRTRHPMPPPGPWSGRRM